MRMDVCMYKTATPETPPLLLPVSTISKRTTVLASFTINLLCQLSNFIWVESDSVCFRQPRGLWSLGILYFTSWLDFDPPLLGVPWFSSAYPLYPDLPLSLPFWIVCLTLWKPTYSGITAVRAKIHPVLTFLSSLCKSLAKSCKTFLCFAC